MARPTKWYVNLRPARNNSHHAGEEVSLVATRKALRRGGATKRKVQWSLVRDFDGLDETILPPDIGALTEGTLVPSGDRVTDELAARRWENTLAVGGVTGAKYTVTARKAAGQGGANVAFSKDYITLRKVYYDVVYMRGTKAHWDAIKRQFSDAWAAVGYEFVENSVRQALVAEDHTDRGRDILLSHLYRGGLRYSPFHVRMVIVRDVCSVQEIDTTWRMDNTTVAGDGVTRVWSTGDTVHYTSPIQLMQATPAACAVRTIQAVAVPDAAITRPSASTVRIALAALDVPRAALAANRKVSLKAKLNATRSTTASFTLKLDHTSKNAPIRMGTATITVATAVGAWTITIQDNARVWAPAPVKTATIVGQKRPKFGDASWCDDGLTHDLVAGAARLNNHAVRFTVPLPTHAVLAAHAPLEYGGRPPERRGLKLQVELLHDPEAVESEVDAVVSDDDDDDAMVRYDAAGSYLEITDPTRIFDGAAPLLAVAPLGDPVLYVAAADVAIPGGAVTLSNGGRQVDFDLTYDGLAGPLHSFQGGDSLEFTAKLTARQSVGGYSPTNHRDFVALTAIKLTADEPDATTRMRMLLAAIHEIGHAHGLVPATFEYGGKGASMHARDSAGAEATNPQHYEDAHGGRGPHCSHNAALAPSGPSYGELPTSSGQVYVHGGGEKLCVMFHAARTAHCAPAFCDMCKNHLRTRGLHRLS